MRTRRAVVSLGRPLSCAGLMALMATVPGGSLSCGELPVRGGSTGWQISRLVELTKDAVVGGVKWVGRRFWENRTTICLCAVVGGVVYLLMRNDKNADDPGATARNEVRQPQFVLTQEQFGQLIQQFSALGGRVEGYQFLNVLHAGLTNNNVQGLAELIRQTNENITQLRQTVEALTVVMLLVKHDCDEQKRELNLLRTNIEALGQEVQNKYQQHAGSIESLGQVIRDFRAEVGGRFAPIVYRQTLLLERQDVLERLVRYRELNEAS